MRREGTPRTARYLILMLVAGLLPAVPVESGDVPPGKRALSAQQEARLREAEEHTRQGRDLRSAGKKAEALTALTKSLAIEREVLGPGLRLEAADTLEELAALAEDREEFATARKTRQEVLAVRKRFQGEKHWQVTNARLAIADVEILAQLDPKQRQLLRLARAAPAKISQIGQLEVASAGVGPGARAAQEKLRQLGPPQKRYRDAAQLAEAACRVLRRLFGEEHHETLGIRAQLAGLRHSLHEYEAARVEQVRILESRLKLLGENHPDTTSSLLDLGETLHELGQYAAARPVLKQAVRSVSAVLGKNHRETAKVLNRLAMTQHALGDYGGAQESFGQLLAIHRKTLPADHPDIASALNNLGSALWASGNAAGAQSYYEEALTLYRKQKGAAVPPQEVISTLNNLGTAFYVQGRNAAARSCYEQALKECDRLPPLHAPQLRGALLTNLGSLLKDQGDFAAARPCYEKALEIYEKQLPPTHPHLATILNNLGTIADAQRDFPAAQRALERALTIRKASLPQGHPETTSTINNLAILLQHEGKYEEARRLFEQALQLGLARHGERHWKIVSARTNLGLLLLAQGETTAARKQLEQAVRICRDLGAPEQSPAFPAFCSLGAVCQLQHEYSAARKHLEQALALQLKYAHNVLGALSEAEALAYVATASSVRDPLLFTMRHLKDITPHEAYRVVWETRALATQALEARRDFAGRDPRAREIWQRLRQMRGQLAQLTLAVVPPEKAKERATHLNRLTADKERLERELARVSAPFRQQQKSQQVAPADLAKLLPRNAAVVDLVKVFVPEESGRKGAWEYDAFVMRRAEAAPGYTVAWIHLKLAEPIEQAATTWRKTFQASGDAAAGQAAAHKLRRLVWEPLEAHLGGCNAVFVIPEAALTQLPWAALPGKETGSYLLESYAIATATHGRQLHDRLSRKPPLKEQVLLVGGVLYDDAPDAPAVKLAVAVRGPVLAGGRLPRWTFLKGSLDEARAISRLYPQPAKVTLLEGAAAGKAMLRDRLPDARYVHLATHGFFADARFRSAFRHDTAGERLSVHGLPMSGERATVTGRNPLILSGVVLARANRTSGPRSGTALHQENGILTAEEVADLDLSGTELVVLSACDTGLGEVAGGEGVFGLQRAFGLAGARSVVASLWKVDDEATRQLMTRFYDNLWHKGLGKLEALRQAQLALLNAPAPSSSNRAVGSPEPLPSEIRKGRARPRLWAAWVLNGDPGDVGAIRVAQSVPAASAPIAMDPPDSVGTLPYWGAGGLAILFLAGLGWWWQRRSRAGSPRGSRVA